MTYGELPHHIGRKTTERVHKSQKDYGRKTKHKNRNLKMNKRELLVIGFVIMHNNKITTSST